MVTHYIAKLTDSNITKGKTIAIIEDKFKNKLEEILGGVQAVVNARKQYMDIFDEWQELPLPVSATPEERGVVDVWESAEEAAAAEAFAGHEANTRDAYFEITMW